MVFTIVINKLLVGFYTLNSLNQNQIIFFFTHAFTNDIKSLQMKFKLKSNNKSTDTAKATN